MVTMQRWLAGLGLMIAAPLAMANSFKPYVEPILDLREANDGVVFVVQDDFCTSRSDYQLVSELDDDGFVALTLLRTTPRICDGYNPAGVALEFSLNELGTTQPLDEMVVKNPFLSSQRGQ